MINNRNMSQVAFLLFSLLRQNVTLVSVLTLDFTGSGKRETLFCTGVRFYLWHFFNCLIVNNTQSQAAAPIPWGFQGKPYDLRLFTYFLSLAGTITSGS